jgi:hypothetical protein
MRALVAPLAAELAAHGVTAWTPGARREAPAAQVRVPGHPLYACHACNTERPPWAGQRHRVPPPRVARFGAAGTQAPNNPEPATPSAPAISGLRAAGEFHGQSGPVAQHRPPADSHGQHTDERSQQG